MKKILITTKSGTCAIQYKIDTLFNHTWVGVRIEGGGITNMHMISGFICNNESIALAKRSINRVSFTIAKETFPEECEEQCFNCKLLYLKLFFEHLRNPKILSDDKSYGENV